MLIYPSTKECYLYVAQCRIPDYMCNVIPTEALLTRTNTTHTEQVDLKYLSEWKDQIKELVVEHISSLKEKIRSPKQKILNDPDVKDT